MVMIMASHNNFQVDRNKASKGINIFKKNRNYSKKSKSERLMDGVGTWASFYRSNPHRFVREYLGMNLKIFQCILIYMMMYNHYFMYLASRGQGKTWITAVFCCVRAILYPQTKIVIASGTKGQSREVIEKIDDMRKESANLAREISDLKTSTNDAKVEFHNGSWIKIVASNDGARSKRANLLIVDEFRMVDFEIISKVLRKFLTAPRSPRYLDKPEYAHLKERNSEIYLSSCWYKSHWSFNRFVAYYKSMMKGSRYFVCGLPYQLAVKEGLLDEEQVRDEMSEDDFDEIGWAMEMEALWFGESERAYFNFEDLDKNRKLFLPIYPKHYYDMLKDPKFKYEGKKDEEIRLLSCDIAGMAGKRNDSSVFSVFRLIPNKKGYDRQIVYMEHMEGGHTVSQAIKIRQLFEDFDCDYLVLDTQNIGLSIFDQLCIPQYDKDRNVEYEPWTCINDERMAERCTYDDAIPKIYSIKGNSQLNSEAAISLKDAFRRGKIKIPVNDMEGNESLKKLKGYDKLSEEEKVDLKIVYTQFTLLVNEMINLENKSDDGIVKLKEPSTKRKDRYSSVSYGNYIASELERQYLKGMNDDLSDYMFFMQSGF